MRLDVATVLAQWSAGGLLGCWVTTRRRLVGVGYGWLVRSIFAFLAVGSAAAGFAEAQGGVGAAIRTVAALLMASAVVAALAMSILTRGAGTTGPRSFDPRVDLIAPGVGFVAVLGAAGASGGPYPLTAARLVAGALLLGWVTDAMLLGHWYLVQPGLPRAPIRELVRLTMLAWPLDVGLLLLPTGMTSVLTGSINDGYGGLLGATWVASALLTLALLFVTVKALDEPYYSAVMAATGLLYLTILTAFGTDVLARALLAR